MPQIKVSLLSANPANIDRLRVEAEFREVAVIPVDAEINKT